MEKIFYKCLITVVVAAIGSQQHFSHNSMRQAKHLFVVDLAFKNVLFLDEAAAAKFQKNLKGFTDVPASQADDDFSTILPVVKERTHHSMKKTLQFFDGELNFITANIITQTFRADALGF